MHCTTNELEPGKTGFFSQIVLDYIAGKPGLRKYYAHTPDKTGLADAIAEKKKHPVNRDMLVKELREQYKAVPASEKVDQNITLLLNEKTFSITTAHQPNIFSGYLYFIYKILHTVKLAEHAKEWFPEYSFVPVYYMGSEDADLDELGKIFLDGDPLVWETDQKGAVGRMNTKGLERIIHQISGRLSIFPEGKNLIGLLRDCYLKSDSVQQATFRFAHALFEKFGVVVMIPDAAAYKKELIDIFKDDLSHQRPSSIVLSTIANMETDGYKVQAQPREINLFYIGDQLRERIVREGDTWAVVNTDIRWNEAALLEELENHPENFSPNVILRGLLQEKILPNIAFIGGGGELAYWLEYKDLFAHYSIPFPILILRNSFLFIPEETGAKMKKAGLSIEDIFLSKDDLLAQKAKQEAQYEWNIEEEAAALAKVFDQMKEKAVQADPTLEKHVEALKSRASDKVVALQKKIIRAEKKKHSAFESKYHSIRKKLFPRNGLQERVDNILPYYAKYGPAFIDMLYENSPLFGKAFVVISEQG